MGTVLLVFGGLIGAQVLTLAVASWRGNNSRVGPVSRIP